MLRFVSVLLEYFEIIQNKTAVDMSDQVFQSELLHLFFFIDLFFTSVLNLSFGARIADATRNAFRSGARHGVSAYLPLVPFHHHQPRNIHGPIGHRLLLKSAPLCRPDSCCCSRLLALWTLRVRRRRPCAPQMCTFLSHCDSLQPLITRIITLSAGGTILQLRQARTEAAWGGG